jgi:hypothetical protein
VGGNVWVGAGGRPAAGRSGIKAERTRGRGTAGARGPPGSGRRRRRPLRVACCGCGAHVKLRERVWIMPRAGAECESCSERVWERGVA